MYIENFFWPRYLRFRQLSPSEQSGARLHDFRNLLGLTRMWLAILGFDDNPGNLQLSAAADVGQWIHHVDLSDSVSGDPHLFGRLRKNVGLLKVLQPVMEDADTFLQTPRREQLEKILSHRIKLAELLKAFPLHYKGRDPRHIELNGPEVLAVYNLFDNALARQTEWNNTFERKEPFGVAVEVDGDIVITNYTIRSRPLFDIYEFGKKGEGSKGKGYGLGLAQMYAGLVGKVVTDEWQVMPQWSQVTFTLGKT